MYHYHHPVLRHHGICHDPSFHDRLTESSQAYSIVITAAAAATTTDMALPLPHL